MIINVSQDQKANELLALVGGAAEGADIQCRSERQYAILKIALIRLQRADLSLSLLDARGAVARQVTARKRAEACPKESIAKAQAAAIAQLEKAFARCKAEGLRVVGFSDSLVAVPESAGNGVEALSSPDALEIDTQDVYHGFDAGLD